MHPCRGHKIGKPENSELSVQEPRLRVQVVGPDGEALKNRPEWKIVLFLFAAQLTLAPDQAVRMKQISRRERVLRECS